MTKLIKIVAVFVAMAATTISAFGLASSPTNTATCTWTNGGLANLQTGVTYYYQLSRMGDSYGNSSTVTTAWYSLTKNSAPSPLAGTYGAYSGYTATNVWSTDGNLYNSASLGGTVIGSTTGISLSWSYSPTMTASNGTVSASYSTNIVIKPQQPWDIVVHKKGVKTFAWKIYSPSSAMYPDGQSEAEGTISGAAGDYNIHFVPLAAPGSGYGTYTLRVGEIPNASSDPIATVANQGNTLSAGPPAGTPVLWSSHWTSTPTEIGAGTSGTGSDGSVANNSGATVTTKWVDASGNFVMAGPTLANGAELMVDGTGLPTPANGATARYKLVDNATGAILTTIDVANYNPDGGTAGPTYTAQGTTTINPPATTGTPSTTQTNTGNASTGTGGTAGGGDSGTKVNNGTTTISGTGTGATVQDMYNATKKALDDSGQDKGVRATPGNVDMTGSTRDRGQIDQVQGKIDAAKAGVSAMRGGINGKLSGHGYSGLSSSFGSISTISVVSLPVLNTSISLDLTNGVVGSKVSLIRTAFLFGLTIGWIMLCMRTVKGYL